MPVVSDTHSTSHLQSAALIPRFSSVFKTLTTSTAIWLLLVLIGFDVFIYLVRPLRYVRVPGVVLRDQDELTQQVETLKSGAQGANTLWFGTSLIRNAAAYADGINEHKAFTNYGWSKYFESHSGDKMLLSQLGVNAKSFTVMVGGGFFYDSWRLLEIAINSGLRPKLIVFTIAPKDFIDSTRSLKDSHVDLFLSLRDKNSEKIKNLGSLAFWLANECWQYYRVKSDYRCVAEVLACSTFNRLPSLYSSLHNKVVKQPNVSWAPADRNIDLLKPLAAEDMATHTRYYKSVFQTAKRENMDVQFDYFRQALKLCLKQGIPCLVVNMPLSRVHQKLLPDNLKQLYLSRLENTCLNQHTVLIDMMEDARFPEHDFVDVVHLNGNGANRFWKLLGQELQRNGFNSPAFVAQFNSR